MLIEVYLWNGRIGYARVTDFNSKFYNRSVTTNLTCKYSTDRLFISNI